MRRGESDHDGEADLHCAGGTDCDDFDETRGTTRAEICGDQIDNDCDEQVDEQNCGKPAHDSCDDALDITTPGTHVVKIRRRGYATTKLDIELLEDVTREVVLVRSKAEPPN